MEIIVRDSECYFSENDKNMREASIVCCRCPVVHTLTDSNIEISIWNCEHFINFNDNSALIQFVTKGCFACTHQKQNVIK